MTIRISGVHSTLVVIVPFRGEIGSGRYAQLDAFIPHITSFLLKFNALFRIFVISESPNQSRRLNRGILLNIGYVIARSSGFTHVVFHDVDLLSSIDLISCYHTQDKHHVHITRVWGRHSNNLNYIGGIITRAHRRRTRARSINSSG